MREAQYVVWCGYVTDTVQSNLVQRFGTEKQKDILEQLLSHDKAKAKAELCPLTGTGS